MMVITRELEGEKSSFLEVFLIGSNLTSWIDEATTNYAGVKNVRNNNNNTVNSLLTGETSTSKDDDEDNDNELVKHAKRMSSPGAPAAFTAFPFSPAESYCVSPAEG